MSEENKNLGEEAKDKLNDAAETAKEKAGELADDAKEVFEGAKEKASELADDAKEAFESAKEKASEFAEDAKEATKEFTEDAKEKVNEFADEAEKTVDEFTAGAREAFNKSDSKKVIAGILGILLGWAGVHKFILGYSKEGLIMLGVSILGFATSCLGIGVFLIWIPSVIGLIEGILYLTKSDEEFVQTYQVNKKPWF